jgi:hypothetical protein
MTRVLPAGDRAALVECDDNAEAVRLATSFRAAAASSTSSRGIAPCS